MKRQTPLPAPAELVIVKSVQTKKLSSRATGQLSYQVGYVPNKSEIYLQLTANEGGGFFSNEWIPASRLMHKLTELKPYDELAAVAFKGLFNGKSSNNASFLAAALISEALLQFHPTKESRLVVSDQFSNWPAQILALEGTLTITQPEQTGNAPDTEVTQNKKPKKGSKPALNEAPAENISEPMAEG